MSRVAILHPFALKADLHKRASRLELFRNEYQSDDSLKILALREAELVMFVPTTSTASVEESLRRSL